MTKIISALLVTLFLTACAGMGTSDRSQWEWSKQEKEIYGVGGGGSN